MVDKITVLNARQAAEYLGTHIETLRRLARRGEIPSFKVGTDWRFSREALSKWCESQLPRRAPITVLVVDDDVNMVRSMVRIVERLGCSTQSATNGAEALELVSKQAPDLILLDLEMPGMNGPEVLEHLRPKYPDLPVVIVTGYPDGVLMDRAYRNGPLLLLPKPALPEQIERTIRTVLGDRLPARAVTSDAEADGN